MGTRADFYIGRGKDAEWLGSIAWDGDHGTALGVTNPEWQAYLLLPPAEQAALSFENRPRPYLGCEVSFEESALATAADADAFRAEALRIIDGRDDGTPAANGWPWPWEDSCTTDYAYAFDGGELYVSNFGSAWYQPHKGETCPSDAAWEAVEAAAQDRKRAQAKGHTDPQALIAAELAYRQALEHAEKKAAVFPNMKHVQDVNYGAGSGISIIQLGSPMGVSPHED